MEIDYIYGAKLKEFTGIYKCNMEISNRFKNELDFNLIDYTPSNRFINLSKKYYSNNSKFYPLNIIKKSLDNLKYYSYWGLDYIDKKMYLNNIKRVIKDNNIKHIPNQELAFIQDKLNLNKTIITCYDIIPWAYDKNYSKQNKIMMEGLKKSSEIITISEYTKQDLIKYLDYPSNHIHVVYIAVDHNRYFPKKDDSIFNKFNIKPEDKLLLYVGTELERQNVDVILKALYNLKKEIPNIKFLKVGNAPFAKDRQHLLNLIKKLNLKDNVIFVGYVSEEDISKWYSTVDVLIYPCKYAGFGLPPLEAMACGTPTITSNTTSLPEVVGDAALMFNPSDVSLLTSHIYDILMDDKLREQKIQKGFNQVKKFSWDENAKKTIEIYQKVENNY